MAIRKCAYQADRSFGTVIGPERNAFIVILFDDRPRRFQIVVDGKADAERIFKPIARIITALKRLLTPAT